MGGDGNVGGCAIDRVVAIGVDGIVHSLDEIHGDDDDVYIKALGVGNGRCADEGR